MKTLRLLHITDLHYSNKKGNYYDTLDIKDKSTSDGLKRNANSLWSKEFIDSVTNWLGKNKTIDAILCTGDIGEKGEEKNVELGVKLLEFICRKLSVSKENLILCPGNHDLKRTATQGSEFTDYETKLEQYGFNNYSVYDNAKINRINDVPIISLNSCMGGTEQSNFIDKYKQIVKKIVEKNPTFRDELENELHTLGQEHLIDFLDIPFVGIKQIVAMENAINDNDSCAIVMMHHNPVLHNSKEVRPYSTLVDGGVILDKLMKKKKKIFIFHGHTHFDYDILSYYPHNRENNCFVSTIGCRTLNDSAFSGANVYEFYLTDNNEHIVTNVFSIQKDSSSGFGDKFICKIGEESWCEDELRILMDIQKNLNKSREISFLKLKSNFSEITDDNVFLRVILQNEWKYFAIDKSDNDYKNWIIRKN